MSELRLVCFDLGGVVVRICRSWQEGCRAAGVDGGGDGAADLDLADWPAFQEVNQLHQTGRIDLATYARRLSDAAGGRHAPHEIAAVHDAWLRGEYEGVAALVDAIHGAGLDTATLSNTSAEHWQVLVDYPAIRRIRHRHASHLLGLAKPDPAIYDAFEARVGRRGDEILFFDDLAENIAAAREAGWRAVRVDPTRPTAMQIARALGEHGVTLS